MLLSFLRDNIHRNQVSKLFRVRKKSTEKYAGFPLAVRVIEKHFVPNLEDVSPKGNVSGRKSLSLASISFTQPAFSTRTELSCSMALWANQIGIFHNCYLIKNPSNTRSTSGTTTEFPNAFFFCVMQTSWTSEEPTGKPKARSSSLADHLRKDALPSTASW